MVIAYGPRPNVQIKKIVNGIKSYHAEKLKHELFKMSADNELAIATFTDCIVVKMQFASWFWDEVLQYDPDEVRQCFQDPLYFETLEQAEEYAFKEELSSYYEYGVSNYTYDYPLNIPES
jgi:hypothetical protein